MSSSARPFAQAPGRDRAKDRPATFDIARYYYDERFRIAEDAVVLESLIAAVDWTNDLAPSQWAQWYSVALGFAPDLIVELGRGRGNSTAVFSQAASRLGHTKVVSLCQSGDWMSTVAPRIARTVEERWFANLDARMTDILTTDYEEILDGRERVLLLWDAHGFEIAEVVLGEILPRLARREHLVIMHDILDNRYADVSRSYGGHLWKGSEWQQRTAAWNARVNIGWLHAMQDQVIALEDFSVRNDVEIGSADHEYAQFFTANPTRAEEMQRVLGDEFFSATAQWAFLSLTGKEGPFHFPAVAARQPFQHRCDVVIDSVDGAANQAIPNTIVTKPRPWEYASMMAWRAGSDIPPDVQMWLRLRLQVEDGSVGVGLLDRNGKDFSARRAISPGTKPVNVELPVADPARPGQLVVQTWDAPVSARVRIDEVTLVW